MQTLGQELIDSIDNNGNEFQIIRGRVCPFHRPFKWCGWQKQDMDIAMAQVRTEVILKPDVVIYLDDHVEATSVLDTLSALNRGDIHPTKVYLANNSILRPSQIMQLMRNCPFPWRAETLIGQPLEYGRALDMITAKCTGIFVTYFYAGYKPPLNFFKPIDIALYDQLDKFVVLEPLPNSMNGMTVLRQFYKQAGGNARYSIVDKAKKISKEQKCQHLVRPVTHIVTQLSQ